MSPLPMTATRRRKVKTDRRGAQALAEACLLGAYRLAHRLSDPRRHVRGRLLVRDAPVRLLCVNNCLDSLEYLRKFGIHRQSALLHESCTGSAELALQIVDRTTGSKLVHDLLEVIMALLAMLRSIKIACGDFLLRRELSINYLRNDL